MAKMPEAPLTPEQQQARNRDNAALLGKIAEYAPFIPNFKSNNTEVKPVAESQAQASQTAVKPTAPTNTSNLASLDAATMVKPVEAKPITAPSVIPKVSPIKTPTSEQGVDVIQGGGKNGTNLYTYVPNDMGNTAQSQAVNASAQPQGLLTIPQQQPRLTQEQIRQIYREDPTIAMGMQNATGIDENGNRLANTAQNRAAEQNRLLTLNPTQQQDPNAYRKSLIAQLNKFGNLGDRSRREMALAQLKMMNDKEQNKENNLAKQQIADQEYALKSPYYQSEAMLNEARARAALTPKQPKPEYHYNEDGTATVIENGLQRKVQTDPRQKLIDKYNTEWAASEALADDDPNKEMIQNQLRNAVSKNNLSDWVDF